MLLKSEGVDDIAQSLHSDRWESFLLNYDASINETIKEYCRCKNRTENIDRLHEFTTHSSEKSSWLDLIKTENIVFNKVIVSLCQFCSELDDFSDIICNKYIPAFKMYEKTCANKSRNEYHSLENISNMNFLFMEISNFLDNSLKLVTNVLFSLENLYSKNSVISEYKSNYSTLVQFLGKFIFSLACFDTCISQSTTLHNHFLIYKRILSTVETSPNKYQIDLKKFKQYYKIINIVEEKLFSNLLNTFLNSLLSNNPKFESMKLSSINLVSSKFIIIANNIIDEIEERESFSSFYSSIEHYYDAIGIYIFYSTVLRGSNVKLLRKIAIHAVKVSVLVYSKSMAVMIDTFLSRYISNFEKIVGSKLIERIRQSVYILKDFNPNSLFYRNINDLFKNVNQWCHAIQQDSLLKLPIYLDNSKLRSTDDKSTKDTSELFNSRLRSIIKKYKTIVVGINLLREVHYLLQFFYYVDSFTTFSKTLFFYNTFISLLHSCHIIRKYFLNFSKKISANLFHIKAYLNYAVHDTLNTSYNSLRKNNTKYDKDLDLSSAIILGIDILQYPLNWQTVVILLNCMEAIKEISNIDTQSLKAYFKELDSWLSLSHLTEYINDISDISYLLFNTNMIDQLCKEVMSKPSNACRLEILTHFMDNASCLINVSVNIDKENKAKEITNLQKTIIEIVNNHIINPLYVHIETDLRFQPFDAVTKIDHSIKHTVDYQQLLQLSPFRIHDQYISINYIIEQMLERTFYNLAAVNPFEWRNYENMRRFAYSKYGLDLLKTYLPIQQIEQGIDLLEITADVEKFINNYSYNINSQIFIQRTSTSKYLKTLNIRHIANSIRIHGVGVANSAVNRIYQLLKQKFFLLSRFLFEEQIKSKVLKEILYFKHNKVNEDKCYPYDRAEQLIRDIRSLHNLNSSIMSIEHYRDLMCQIGNIMGLVRMLRNGIFSYLNGFIEFIPDLCNRDEIILQLSPSHSDTTKNSTKWFEESFKSVLQLSNEGTEYYDILFNVFYHHFQDEKNSHLKNFYITVPSLIISSVEHIIKKIDSIGTKDKECAGFTEDGTILGISFILRLLDQYSDFDNLRWFSSMKQKIIEDRNKLSSQLKNKEERLLNALQLSLNRSKFTEQIASQTEYNLFCTRLFFIYKKKTDKSDQSTEKLTQNTETSNINNSE